MNIIFKCWKAISLCDTATLPFQSNCLTQTVRRAVINLTQNMSKEIDQWKSSCYCNKRS